VQRIYGKAIFLTGINWPVARDFLNCSMNKFKSFVEWNAFGVCSAIGDRMGIATSRIRQYFIYTSLLTMGSPIIIYMILAFWRNMRKYVKAARRNPWYYL
jgi:phage shock protein PspC (stress-responsive transcriptional regulator)